MPEQPEAPNVEKYLERNPIKPGRAEAVIAGTGVPVWAIVGYWQGVGDVQRVAHDFALPLAAILAALE